jgi:hypothetical protein
MKPQFTSIIFLFTSLLTLSTGAFAQVQVSKEPHHHPVIVNDYMRLLDVWVDPGDTTGFHVHSTPSLFVHMTNTNISTQIKSEAWIQEKNVAGKTWYKAFKPDILFHRVANNDTAAMHVIVMEMLSAYNGNPAISNSPLPYPVFLSNEKAFVYKLNNAQVEGMNISGRGPMVVILVSGGTVAAENLFAGSSADIKAGDFIYIAPGTDYHFTCKDKGELNMVIFELK